MYSKKSQSELIENKDYNMVLLLPHNATKIIYFSKSFSIRFFLLVIKEYYVFLKVAANVPRLCDERNSLTQCFRLNECNKLGRCFKVAEYPLIAKPLLVVRCIYLCLKVHNQAFPISSS